MYRKGQNANYIPLIIFGVIILFILVFSFLGSDSSPYIHNPNDYRAFGELWNYTEAGYMFTLPNNGIYYNLTGLVPGDTFLNANYTNNGASYITVKKRGTYELQSTLTIESSTAGGLYGVIIARNFNITDQRDCYIQQIGSGSYQAIKISCLHKLEPGDHISIMVDDETSPTKPFNVLSANLYINLIG